MISTDSNSKATKNSLLGIFISCIISKPIPSHPKPLWSHVGVSVPLVSVSGFVLSFWVSEVFWETCNSLVKRSSNFSSIHPCKQFLKSEFDSQLCCWLGPEIEGTPFVCGGNNIFCHYPKNLLFESLKLSCPFKSYLGIHFPYPQHHFHRAFEAHKLFYKFEIFL